MRGERRQDGGDRGLDRGTYFVARGSRRGARLEHGQGSRRRLRAPVRGSRRTPAQGHSRGMAPFHARALTANARIDHVNSLVRNASACLQLDGLRGPACAAQKRFGARQRRDAPVVERVAPTNGGPADRVSSPLTSCVMAAASASITKRIQELGDWRGETLAHVRQLIHDADPDIQEEWKWEKA